MEALRRARQPAALDFLYAGYTGLGFGLLLAALKAAGVAMPPALPVHMIAMAGRAGKDGLNCCFLQRLLIQNCMPTAQIQAGAIHLPVLMRFHARRLVGGNAIKATDI